MSVNATITPLRSGRAIYEVGGLPREFPSWRAAADEADACRVAWRLLPFPPPSIESVESAPAVPV